MDEKGYAKFLEDNGIKRNGINFRISKANVVMDILKKPLDAIVSDDEEMYKAIIELRKKDDPAHAPLQNTLRKYYAFRNSKEFPRIADYEKNRK